MLERGKESKTRPLRSYGDFILVFKGSGYKVYHVADEEYQVIFDYREPKSLFFILGRKEAQKAGLPVKTEKFNNYDFAVYGCGKSGSPMVLYADQYPYKCLEWIMSNGDAYSNSMFRV